MSAAMRADPDSPTVNDFILPFCWSHERIRSDDIRLKEAGDGATLSTPSSHKAAKTGGSTF